MPESDAVSGSPMIAAAGPIWVVSYFHNEVLRIDPHTLRVLARTGVGRSPAGVGRSPAGVVFDGTSVWVYVQHNAALARIDPALDFVVQTVPVGNRRGSTGLGRRCSTVHRSWSRSRAAVESRTSIRHWVVNGALYTRSCASAWSDMRTSMASSSRHGMALIAATAAAVLNSLSRIAPDGHTQAVITVGLQPEFLDAAFGSVWISDHHSGSSRASIRRPTP